jgi:O-antigen/teichoic acid export membrane protein
LVLSVLIGERTITLLYKSEYGKHANILVLLMISATLWFASSFLSAGIIAANSYREMVPIFFAATVVTGITALFLVPSFHLEGAAWALSAGMAVRVVASCLILVKIMNRPPVQSETLAPSASG